MRTHGLFNQKPVLSEAILPGKNLTNQVTENDLSLQKYNLYKAMLPQLEKQLRKAMLNLEWSEELIFKDDPRKDECQKEYERVMRIYENALNEFNNLQTEQAQKPNFYKNMGYL